MKTVKLSDFSPYDRNKGGIQELHHKIESKTLQYWGKDSGILIGITPIYKIRLWSEEVKVVNDKMTNMKTRTYEGVQHGDWVRCVLCGAQMLLPCGADKCPECSSKDTLMWVDENRQEMDAKHLDCLVPIRKLELQEYLSPEILKMEHISGIKVADPEDNYEWTNKDGNEKYFTKNLPKAHFRWDWRRYTLSKESVDKITEFVDTILES